MTGIEVSESIVRSLTISIFASLVEGGGKAFSQAGDSLRQRIYLASRQYDQSYIERHGILKVLGMREPILLESVYVAVQFSDDRATSSLETIEALEEVYRRSQQRGFQSRTSQKSSGVEVANQKQYLMVLGGPGMGKTTFLRKMGLEALKGKREGGFQHNCIPVFIELKGFRTRNLNLEEAIAQIFRIRGFPEHHRFTSKALEKGKLLILLDGLDEVPSEYMHEVATKIQNFVDLYDKNRYIISCRLAAYRYNFRRFTDVSIADFSDDQIENFITNWFSKEPEKGQECWQKLISYNYAAAKELTHTPLLLTLICLLYQRAGQFPTNRATLYEKALRVLLEEWAGEKGIPQESIYKGLDTKRKELMLSEIAYYAFEEDRLFLYKREIANQIESLLKEMLPDEAHINGGAVLKSIEKQHGILVERAEGIYSFSHLTFQEFLAAQHIVDNSRQIQYLIENHLTDERWQEIFLLLAGLKRADDLILQINAQILLLVENPKLKILLRWCDQAISSTEGGYKLVVKRAIALFFALELGRSLATHSPLAQSFSLGADYTREIALEFSSSDTLNHIFDLTLVQNLSVEHAIHLIIEIAQVLEESQIFQDVKFNGLIAKLKALKMKSPVHQQTAKTRKIFTEELTNVWLTMLNLHKEWLTDLSREEILVINKYLYANLLMAQCRKAAVRISLATWHEVEEQMLRLNPAEPVLID